MLWLAERIWVGQGTDIQRRMSTPNNGIEGALWKMVALVPLAGRRPHDAVALETAEIRYSSAPVAT